MLASTSAGDVADIALAIFLVASGLGLGWALLRLGSAFGQLSSFIRGTESELLPVINKVGGSVDRLNAQLDKLDEATASAVEAVDQAVRTVSSAVKRPAQKAAGVAAGMSHGWSRFVTSRNWRDAVEEARAAAARREQDIEDELKSPSDPPAAPAE